MALVRILGLAAVLGFTAASALVPAQRPLAADPALTYRAFLPQVAAHDSLLPPLPPADPSYCPGSGGPSSPPPNSVLGLLTIGGNPAPPATVVQLVFDGKLGPADFTREAGGYRVDFSVGADPCSNRKGARIALLVAGQVFESTAAIGDTAADPVLRFNVAVP